MVSQQRAYPVTKHSPLVQMRKFPKRQLVIYALLLAVALVSTIPLGWMVVTSLKSKPEIYIFPPTLWPQTLQFQNYLTAWNYPGMHFALWTINTLLITMTVVVGVLLTSSLCAYGFARIPFPGRNFLFLFTLCTMMLPPQVTLIPLYMLFHQIGWLDTLLPLTAPAWFGGGALNIFLLRQFFLGISLELDDAAYMDGATRFQIWHQIALPMSMPALVTIAIFTVQRTWDDFYGPLIYLSSAKNFTLALGINLFRGTFTEELRYLLAIAVLMTLPMILLFFLLQPYYVQGVVLTGRRSYASK
jgi:ABC-type glycerol-3-phosphate transport system permease component